MSLSHWVAANGSTLLLDGSQGVKVERGVVGLDGPPIRNTIDARVGDGATRVSFRRPERAFTLPLILDTDVVSARAVVAAFQGPGELHAASGRVLRSVVYESGLEGVWSVEAGGVTGLSHRKFALSLVALDPWWYGIEQSASGTFGAGTAWNAAVAWNANVPWDGGASRRVSNTGDVATPVDVVVKGAATTASFSVGGMGGWVTAATILTNEFLSVSGDAGDRGPRRGPAGHFAGADGPIAWNLLTEGSQLFDLPAGQSSLVFGATGTDGNTAWSVFWSPRFFTP